MYTLSMWAHLHMYVPNVYFIYVYFICAYFIYETSSMYTLSKWAHLCILYLCEHIYEYIHNVYFICVWIPLSEDMQTNPIPRSLRIARKNKSRKNHHQSIFFCTYFGVSTQGTRTTRSRLFGRVVDNESKWKLIFRDDQQKYWRYEPNIM